MKEYRNEDGELHRINAPAIEYNGDYAWWYNGWFHRYYGIACQWGGNYTYYIFGEWMR